MNYVRLTLFALSLGIFSQMHSAQLVQAAQPVQAIGKEAAAHIMLAPAFDQQKFSWAMPVVNNPAHQPTLKMLVQAQKCIVNMYTIFWHITSRKPVPFDAIESLGHEMS